MKNYHHNSASGIYVHIPYCRQACHYCNFHFSTQLKSKDALITALLEEIVQRKKYLPQEFINSIYFGGGTPSLFSSQEIETIFQRIKENYEVSFIAEWTMEVNPDDVTDKLLEHYVKMGVNRLSIGIQSFHDRELKFMNRAHDSIQAKECVKLAKKHGLNKISVDLIYGVPDSTKESWKENLDQFIELNVDHLSAYNLTLEEKTAYHHLVKQGKAEAPDQDLCADQFMELMAFAKKHNFEHYEISNFARNGMLAIHNTNYWKEKCFIGFGPGAHSFNGKNRQWNVSDNQKYIKALSEGLEYFESEPLDTISSYNEYVMTSLRTQWGVQKKRIKEFAFENHFQSIASLYVDQKKLVETESAFMLTDDGKMIADRIIEDLFKEHE